MKTLYIDTHLWNVVVVLFENGKVLRKKEIFGEKNNSTLIFPTIEEVLNREKFDSIIVVNGPGSFTGVRLGVTIAKTFAYTLNLPIRTITSLECMAVSNSNKKVAISDGNGYYLGIFDDDMNLQEEYKYINEEEFLKIDTVETNVILDYEKIYEYVMTKDTIESHLVNPIYIKKIGVEK